MTIQSYGLRQEAVQQLKQMQRLVMKPELKQALYLLQLPVLELSSAIEEEMEQNPILEFSRGNQSFLKAQVFQESFIPAQTNLFDQLWLQAREAFSEKDLNLARILIGNIERNGYLTTSLEEIAVCADVTLEEVEAALKIIHTFEPLGIGAFNLQETILLQLKESSLAYKIAKECFDELLHNAMPKIAKKLNCSIENVKEALKEILKVHFHPAAALEPTFYVTPDLFIKEEGEKLSLLINDEVVPSFCINKKYLKMLRNKKIPKDTRLYILSKIASAKWLSKGIYIRNETLNKIGKALIFHQEAFFKNPQATLKPMTMNVLSVELGLHESTITRAIANKYISCSRGIIPLRSFFTSKLPSDSGEEISSQQVKEMIQHFVKFENKAKPLSDEKIVFLLKEKGIACARRTISKYREELNIGSSFQRKSFFK